MHHHVAEILAYSTATAFGTCRNPLCKWLLMMFVCSTISFDRSLLKGGGTKVAFSDPDQLYPTLPLSNATHTLRVDR